MLEERLKLDLKRWGFLFTEMVLIVASILLAFALDSWWDERKDRVEEAEILQGLKQEFLLNQSKLESRIEAHLENILAMEELLAATQRGSWQSSEIHVDQAIAALLAPPTTDLGNGVLEALIGSGRIELIRNRELRARLAAWDGVFAEVSDDEIMSRDFVFNRIIPYLVDNGIPISGPMSRWPGEWHKNPRSIADDPEAMARLLADPRFSVLLEARLGFKMHTTGEYRDAMAAAEEILADIESSL